MQIEIIKRPTKPLGGIEIVKKIPLEIISLTRLRVRELLKQYVKNPAKPYQEEGIAFCEYHNGNIVNCDDMGLGKSYQSLAWCAIHPELRPVIVVCPSSLKYNWQREWKMHSGLKAYVCDGNVTTKIQDRIELVKRIDKIKEKAYRTAYDRRRAIINTKRSMRARRVRTVAKRRAVRNAQIIIVNYDVLKAWLPVLLKLNPQVVIIDECHNVKNRKAKRTKACKKLAREAPHVIGLSGTPISGKPAEFFPILQMVRPEEFTSFWKYAFEYCAPTKNSWSGSWDFGGVSNLDSLRRRLKSIMIRRLKHKVLPDLPKKTRTILPVDIDNRKEYDKAEEDFLSWLLRAKGQDAFDRAARAEAIVRMNSLKLLAAKGMLATGIQWIKDWLQETTQKLLVFGIHKAILGELKKHFPEAMVVDGSVSPKPVMRTDADGKMYETSKRQEMVDRFQEDPKQRLLFGQLKAAGEGLNITAASNVLFLEVGWTPGSHNQAEDRVLRIGQKNKVSIYYMVGKDTIMRRLLTIIQEKDETVSRILDGKKTGSMNLLTKFIRLVGGEAA